VRRLLLLLLAMVAAASDVAAQTTPFPLPRVFRQDDPANVTIGPFLLLPGQPNIIFLQGPIEDDAPAAFVRALRERPAATVLGLVSDGGLVDPAMLVAREVRRRGLATLVPPGAVCASACAFIFLAGTERVALGQLGVHQISNDDNDLVAGQTALADVFRTLREFGVSDDVVAAMLATPPDEVHFFTQDELTSWGIETEIASTDFAGGTADVPALAPSGGQSLLLEASDDGKTGAVPFSGTVSWLVGSDEAGLPTLIGTAWISARDLGVDMVIRKNVDTAIPASHLITVRFKISDSFIGGSVAGMPGVLLKNEELIQGLPLVGSSRRLEGNSFQMALSSTPEDVRANTDLLSARSWIDLAVIYATGKRAIVTLEKDAAAQEMFRSVFDTWRDVAEGRRIAPAGIPENVTVLPMTRLRQTEASRMEKFVRVEEDGSLEEVLLRNGFTEQTAEMMVTTMRNSVGVDQVRAGTWLRILFGPSRATDKLIPYRLSFYAPAEGSEPPRHLATAALTDRGSYVHGLAPEPVAFPGEVGPTFAPIKALPSGDPNGKSDRLRPVLGAPN
jgi:hypothetical protein